MFNMKEDIIQEKRRRLFPTLTKSKIEHPHEKDVNEIKISLLFLIAFLLFPVTWNISMKSKDTMTKDNILPFDYYNRTKDTEKMDLNIERNYLGTYGYKYQDITLIPLLFLYSTQEIFTKSLLPSLIENANYFILFFENALLYKESSRIKNNHNIFNKISNINKFKENYNNKYNNLKKYKETKTISSFKTILYETILNKDVLSPSFGLDIYRERREEKRREEKRREEKNCNPGEAPKTKGDLNESCFYKVENIFEKTLNLKGIT